MNILTYSENLDITRFVITHPYNNYIVLAPINMAVANYLYNRGTFEDEKVTLENYGFEEYVERFGSLVFTAIQGNKLIFSIRCYTDKEFSYISLLMGLVKLNKSLQHVRTRDNTFCIIGPNINVDYKEVCDIIESEMDEDADLCMFVREPARSYIIQEEEQSARRLRNNLATSNVPSESLESTVVDLITRSGFTVSGSTTVQTSSFTAFDRTTNEYENIESSSSSEIEEEDERYSLLNDDPVDLLSQDDTVF